MFPGWLAAAIACALGVALAIVAMPAPPAEEGFEPAAFDQQIAIAATRARETGIAERPEWSVGEAWRVQFDEGEPVCWLVVVDATEGYRQGVACETDESEAIAVNLAVWQEPWIASFTKDLEAVGDGTNEPTRWFDWPLEHGKSWTTSYAGVETVVRVEHNDGAFELTMALADSEETFATYDYDPSIQWWSQLRFEDSGYEFRVHAHEIGWSGPVATAVTETQLDTESNLVSQFTAEFAATEEDDYVVLVYTRGGVGRDYWQLDGPGVSHSSLTQANPTSLSVLGPSFVYDLVPAEPGDWTYRQAGAGFDFRVRVLTADVTILDL